MGAELKELAQKEEEKPPVDDGWKPPEKNLFWEWAGYNPGEEEKKEEPEEEKKPLFSPPSQLMKAITHYGVMQRIRKNKDKSEY